MSFPPDSLRQRVAQTRSSETQTASSQGSLDALIDKINVADHASYLASWLKVLKNDTKAIFTAASKASEAADFLSGLAEA